MYQMNMGFINSSFTRSTKNWKDHVNIYKNQNVFHKHYGPIMKRIHSRAREAPIARNSHLALILTGDRDVAQKKKHSSSLGCKETEKSSLQYTALHCVHHSSTRKVKIEVFEPELLLFSINQGKVTAMISPGEEWLPLSSLPA